MSEQYTTGDWIVHRHHGAGQIKGTETKRIGGQEGLYHKIEMRNSIMWVPDEQLNSEWFRPLASRREFRDVLAILERPAHRMANNFTTRQGLIRKVKRDNSLAEVARMVRDLWTRQARKSISGTEERELRSLTQRLIEEWSVTMHIEREEAKDRLYHILNENQLQQATAD